MKKLLIFLISILVFYSCEKELESIQLDKNEITIHYDESYQLNVSFSPTDVDIPPIFTWSSENTEVAEVDQNGFVEGVKIGETDITVQTEDAKFQAVCKVIIEPKELESIQLDKNEITIHYDENYQLNVSFSPTDVSFPPVLTWYSENTEVAEIDQNGFVEGVKIGEADITVQTEDAKFQAVCKVIIEPISSLYKEPVIEFGESISYVKGEETREFLSEVTDALMYEGENENVDYVMYLFEFNKLTGSAILLADKTSVLEEANTFLDERYDYIGKIDNVLFFRVNANTVAGLTYNVDLGLVVLYMENSDTKSTSSLYELFNQRLNDLRK